MTDPIEEAIQELPEIDFITSTSKTGVSIVMVNIRDEFDDMRPIWDDLRRKVERVVPELPEGVVRPQVNDEFGDVFGIMITLTGEGYSYAELKQVADEMRDELLRVPDVAKVDIYGAQNERIFVDYDNARPCRARPVAAAASVDTRQREHHRAGREHPHRHRADRTGADRQLRIGCRPAPDEW